MRRMAEVVMLLLVIHTVPVCAASFSASATDSRADKTKVVQAIQKQLLNERGKPSASKRMLRVVYFCPEEIPVAKDVQGRIERVMFDVRDFYQEAMAAYGVDDWILPLELVAENLKLHVVRGKEKSEAYDYNSGQKIMGEIRSALGNTIQFKKEHVIVFHGLCDKDPNDLYHIHAPYYGSAAQNNQSGVCHVADCEMLDPLYFKETQRKIRYTEHTGKFEQTLADFNTKYIGGVAHELGHALGLPHVSEAGQEARLYGTALMGSGNHTYRRELWHKQRRGSFLTMASAVRLLSHPLYTQCEPEAIRSKCDLSALTFSSKGQTLTVQGDVTGVPSVYTIVMHVDPEGRSDYDSDASVGTVVSDKFNVSLLCWKPGVHELKLDVYQANGTHRSWRFPFVCNAQAEPDASRLMGDWLVRQAEEVYLAGDISEALKLAKKTLDRNDVHVKSKRALQHLINLGELKPRPVPLATVDDEEVYLSDIQWDKARVGWGKPSRNQYWHGANNRDAVLLKTGGEYFEKGLYAHAPSSYVFDLGGKFSRLKATVGLQEGVAWVGSGVFIVRGDGKERYRTKCLKPGETEVLDVDIDGVTKLELVVESGKEGNACCWTIWANPRILR